MSVADVQILSSASVSAGEGVYWMFYSGGSFEPVQLPAGLSQVRGAGCMPWSGVLTLGKAVGDASKRPCSHAEAAPSAGPSEAKQLACCAHLAARSPAWMRRAGSWRACACAPAWPCRRWVRGPAGLGRAGCAVAAGLRVVLMQLQPLASAPA